MKNQLDRVGEVIHDIASEAGRTSVEQLDRTMRLREDLGMDSLELAVLTVRLEAEYQVDIFVEGVVTTVGDILDKLGGR